MPISDVSIHLGKYLEILVDPAIVLDAENDVLSYNAYNQDGGSIPAWLTFDNVKLKFYGVTSDPLNVKIYNLGV